MEDELLKPKLPDLKQVSGLVSVENSPNTAIATQAGSSSDDEVCSGAQPVAQVSCSTFDRIVFNRDFDLEKLQKWWKKQTALGLFLFYWPIVSSAATAIVIAMKDNLPTGQIFVGNAITWQQLLLGVSILVNFVSTIALAARQVSAQSLTDENRLLRQKVEAFSAPLIQMDGDYSWLVENVLKLLFDNLGFGTNHRITIYMLDEDANCLKVLGRYTSNKFHRSKSQRKTYPLNEGVIGQSWEKGFWSLEIAAQRSKNKTRYETEQCTKGLLPKEVVQSLRMESRSYLGYRLDIKQKGAAVVIVECTKHRGLKDCADELSKQFDGDIGNALLQFVSWYRMLEPSAELARKDDF